LGHLGTLWGHLVVSLSSLGQDRENELQKALKNSPALIDFGDHFGVISRSCSGPFLGSILEEFLGYFWDRFGVIFGPQDGPDLAQTAPEELSRPPKQQKNMFAENLKKRLVF